MKLLLCPDCQDVFKLAREPRSCRCGLASGRYLDDGLNAVISPGAIPLGFDNQDLAMAVAWRPTKGMGRCFKAFVIPVECPTVRVVDEV